MNHLYPIQTADDRLPFKKDIYVNNLRFSYACLRGRMSVKREKYLFILYFSPAEVSALMALNYLFLTSIFIWVYREYLAFGNATGK